MLGGWRPSLLPAQRLIRAPDKWLSLSKSPPVSGDFTAAISFPYGCFLLKAPCLTSLLIVMEFEGPSKKVPVQEGIWESRVECT